MDFLQLWRVVLKLFLVYLFMRIFSGFVLLLHRCLDVSKTLSIISGLSGGQYISYECVMIPQKMQGCPVERDNTFWMQR